MQKMQVDHLLVCGEQRAGTGVGWITGWPTTTEALVIVSPNEKNLMFVEWHRRAGVQVGELVHITDHGFERLHKAPRAFFRAG